MRIGGPQREQPAVEVRLREDVVQDRLLGWVPNIPILDAPAIVGNFAASGALGPAISALCRLVRARS
jgi:hypothetical protein